MQYIVDKLVWCLIGISCLLLPLGCSEDDTPQSTVIPKVSTTTTKKPVVIPSGTDEESEKEDFQGKYSSDPPDDDKWITFGQFRSPKPITWSWVPPRSTLVTCNYTLPSLDDDKAGTFAIFQYEPGESGDLKTNSRRWEALFRTHNGAPVKSKIEQRTIRGKDATIVELRGEYMGTSSSWHLADQTLLIVIMKEETKTVFFKLLGPTSTINAQRESFYSFLDAIQLLLPAT